MAWVLDLVAPENLLALLGVVATVGVLSYERLFPGRKRIGFRVGPGFNERVVFRELFPRGLTLLDLKDVGVSSLSMSNVAARQELRELVRALGLPGVEVRF